MSNDDVGQSTKAAQDKKRILELMLKKKGIISSGSQAALIPRRSDENDLLLSNAQQRLWFLEELTVDTVAYIFCNRIDLQGEIDLSVLCKAYQAIVDRHEIFRTSYQQKDGVPVQVIHQNIVIQIPLIDLTDLSGSEQKIKFQKVIDKESKTPFNMSVAPLMRMCVVKLSDQHHVVLQTIHHIAYDGWSLAIIYNELKSLYDAFAEVRENPLADLDIQYADYASWMRGRLDSPDMQEKLNFWKQNLAGDLPVLELPVDKPRPATQSYNGALHRIKFSSELTSTLNEFASKNECTVFMVLMTAFKILLHRYTGETDIIVGTPVANRNYYQIEKLIGLFVNSLVLRANLEDDPDVIKLLARVRETASQAFDNQEVPFEKIVDELNIERDVSHNPVFQVMFAYQNTPDLPAKIGGADMELEILDNDTSVFDITLNLHDSASGIYGYIEYCTDVFEAQTIERMAEHYKNLLESMIANPASKISQLQLMGSKEKNKILNSWNETSFDYATDQCIHWLIEEQARINPNAKAICHKDKQLAYVQLNEKANQLARHLITLGMKPDKIVGICMERSIEMFVSILGILKTGGAYLPLDPSYPNDRLNFMLQDTEAEILICKQSIVDDFPGYNGKFVCIDSDLDEINQYDKSNLNLNISTDNLAYIIYTSGSTGKPKGVMVTHHNLVHSTMARIEYYPEKIQRFLLLSSFAFDSSVAGIFWTLCQGGELHLPEQGIEKDIQQVAALLQQVQATHMLSLPSIYGLLLGVAEENQLNSLNTIIVAGEACSVELLIQHEKTLPKADLYNEYGPTEGTVWSTVYKLEKNTDHHLIPVGKPVPNVKIYILDENLQPVPVGVTGEIYIGGSGVTRGYLNREEMTTEKFIKTPFEATNKKLYKTGDLAKYLVDGNIIFCGRTDNQVKVRGYRIELGEIEDAILQNQAISQCVVLVHKTDMGDSRLIAYIESRDEDTTTLNEALVRQLPAYMIPSVIIALESLPLMPNGKINRKALPGLADSSVSSKQEFVDPDNSVEFVIAKIWIELLEIDRVSANKNFFELGGHSILVMRVVARIYESFDVQIAIRYLFDSPTVQGLAAILLADEENAERINETADLIMQIDSMSEEEIDALMSENDS